jgi:hypothetical protein
MYGGLRHYLSPVLNKVGSTFLSSMSSSEPEAVKETSPSVPETTTSVKESKAISKSSSPLDSKQPKQDRKNKSGSENS